MRRWATTVRLAGLGRRVLVLLVLWACYRFLLQLSLTYFPNSDNASPLLAAEDMLHGNWVLRGWWLTTDFFWLTDLPFYTVGIAIRGLMPSLTHEVPAAIYVGVIVIVAFAILSPLSTARTDQLQTKGIAVMAALMPLLFPADLLGNLTLMGQYHTATTGCVLGSFLMMHYALLGGHRRELIAFVVVATALLAGAIMSDPLAVWIGAVPAILTSLILIYGRPTRLRGSPLVPASVAITGWLIAKIGLQILKALRGLPLVTNVPASFVDIAHLGTNVSLFAQGLLELFGANFFGLPASVRTLPVLVRLLGCLAVLASIGLVWRGVRKHGDSLSQLLSTSAIVLVGAFVFSAAPQSIWAARYLVPLVVFGSVLLGRRARWVMTLTTLKESLVVLGVASVLTGLYASAPIARLRHPAPARAGRIMEEARDWPSVIALGSWLAAHGLREGYGPYWAASIVTVATRGAVSVRPVSVDQGDDEIHPFEWYAKCSWYRDPAARFVVAKEGWGNVDLRTVTLTFGRPTTVHAVAGYTVFEWDHPIQVRLSSCVV